MPIRLMHITTVSESLFFLSGQAAFFRLHGVDEEAISSPGPDLARFATEEGIAVAAVPMPRAITPLRDILALWRLLLALRRRAPHIVHAHTPKGGLFGMLAATLARVPVRIYHMHGLPFVTAKGLRRRILIASERIACALADRVLCVSPSVREVAVRADLCPAAKIEVLLSGSINGVDARGRFLRGGPEGGREAVRKRYAIPGDAKVIGFVGRLVRDKGIAELGEAFRIVLREWPSAHVLLVGPFEDQDALDPRDLAALRGEPHVHFAGSSRDLPPFYAAMDLVVLPSRREGLPVVPLEAAAMGLPVIGTRIPGCVDAIVDGITGTLVAVRDPPALARAIDRYLRDPALAERHGFAGRQRVLRDFEPQRMWTELLRVYRGLLPGRGAGKAAPLRLQEAA